jgi:hypothetical protein
MPLAETTENGALEVDVDLAWPTIGLRVRGVRVLGNPQNPADATLELPKLLAADGSMGEVLTFENELAFQLFKIRAMGAIEKRLAAMSEGIDLARATVFATKGSK